MWTLEKALIKPEDSDMPDDIWQTYYFLVNVCNSLNACQGMSPARLPNRASEVVRFNLERAQDSIMFLLKESGRLQRYLEWEEEQKKKRAQNDR